MASTPETPAQVEDVTDEHGIRKILDREHGILLFIGRPVTGSPKIVTGLALLCLRRDCKRMHSFGVLEIGLN